MICFIFPLSLLHHLLRLYWATLQNAVPIERQSILKLHSVVCAKKTPPQYNIDAVSTTGLEGQLLLISKVLTEKQKGIPGDGLGSTQHMSGHAFSAFVGANKS